MIRTGTAVLLLVALFALRAVLIGRWVAVLVRSAYLRALLALRQRLVALDDLS
jgi:hypothetical protein